MLPAVLLIARKELAQRLRDRSFFIIGLAAPLALAFVFNLIIGGAIQGNLDEPFDYGLHDADGGAIAEAFAGQLAAIEGNGDIVLTRYDTPEAAEQAVEDGDLDAAFLVPSALSVSVMMGQPAAIAVVGNIDSGIGTAVARAIAEGFGRGVATATLGARTAAEVGAITLDQLPDAAAAAGEMLPPITFTTTEIRSRQLPAATFFVAGLGLFFMFFVAGLAATSLLEERGLGTLGRLLSTPIPPASIIAGKTLANVGLGILAMVVLAVLSSVLMGAEWGNPVLAFLVIAAAVIAAAGVMTLVGGLARTAEQAGNLQSIVAITLAMLGGTFVPITAGEGLMAQLRFLTPNAWYVRGLGDVGGGATGSALLAVAILLVIGVVTGAIGLARVQRTLKP
ncbi:MAG: ABC transporter permease [Bauldia sp.]|nr:ABC transporter permease [Bauldia sp.]